MLETLQHTSCGPPRPACHRAVAQCGLERRVAGYVVAVALWSQADGSMAPAGEVVLEARKWHILPCAKRGSTDEGHPKLGTKQ